MDLFSIHTLCPVSRRKGGVILWHVSIAHTITICQRMRTKKSRATTRTRRVICARSTTRSSKRIKKPLCTRFRIRRKQSDTRSISRRAPSRSRTWLHPCRIVTVRSTTPSRRRLQCPPMKIKWVSPTSVTEANPIRQRASRSLLSSLRHRS